MGTGFLGSRSELAIMAQDEGHPDPESVKNFGELLNWIAGQTSQKPELKKFRNPLGNWEYRGTFSIKLTSDAYRDIIPQGARLVGDTIHVREGIVRKQGRGIRFCVKGTRGSAFWVLSLVRIIRDGEGRPLWVNKRLVR